MNAYGLMGASWFVGVATAALAFLLGRLIYRRGKVQILWYDPDSARARLQWLKPRGNEVPTPLEGTALLEAEGRISERQGALWVVHPRHGWNLRGPSDAETVNASLKMHVWAITNPKSYRRATHRNGARDTMAANDSSEHWSVRVAPFALLALLLLLVGMGVIIYRLWDVGADAATDFAQGVGARGP